MKKLSALLLVIMIMSAAMMGCENESPETTLPSATTIPDIFTEPPKPTTPALTHPMDSRPGSGGVSHGFGSDLPHNERGRYLVYEGGELHATYKLNATGDCARFDIGLFLFLDGQPQPYKTSEMDTYSYMHIFRGTADSSIELIFTPVTGEAGETLELYGMFLLNPEFYPGDPTGPFQTMGSATSSTQLIFEATPDPLELPDLPQCAVTQTVRNEDLTASEIAGWSAEDLEMGWKYTLKVNGSDSGVYSYNIEKDSLLNLRLEIWGNPYTEYGIVFFVDHAPVAVEPDQLAFISTPSGKKAVVEAEIDLSSFDGEAVVFAAVVTRNYYSHLDALPYTEFSKTCYLSSAATFEEMIAQHNAEDHPDT